MKQVKTQDPCHDCSNQSIDLEDSASWEALVLDLEQQYIADMMGREFGGFRIVAYLATGGMSTVFRAVNQDGVQAALKLMQPGCKQPLKLRRFRRECTILSKLNHPHIAGLLGYGMAADGQPYALMEYIPGCPLDVICKEGNIGLRRRLALFLQLCEGVAYVHRMGVIHRDLKPGNLLVTKDGNLKIVDFGIARSLETRPPLTTQPDTFSMTPGYAAPEQIVGEPATESSDIYALGVILYQLITGRHPFLRPESPCLDPQRAVLELTPMLPSALVDTLGPGKGLRSTDGLKRVLREELDSIALKAMQRRPGRRYAGVLQMADAIKGLRINRHNPFSRGLPLTSRAFPGLASLPSI